jgi:cytochrome c-type biogenesis protein CcmI
VSSDLLPAILGIVLVAVAAAFVLLPFARGPHLESVVPSDNPTADRLRLYQQLLELEFDRDVGKLSQSDFEQLSAELLAQAGAALRDERGAMGAVDAEIEREIAAARAAFAAARQSTRETSRITETPVP